VVDAVRAALPGTLFGRRTQAADSKPRRAGRSGSERASAQRGRQIGVRRGDPRVRRLDVVATLQAAAPWQRLRQATVPDVGAESRLIVTRDDFRVRQFRHRASTSTIFVVDASGSAARARMAEAKGAVELLLSESYARRDRVSLIAFGGRTARCLLPPTRALARARRELAGMAAGGGTPLAAALDLAHKAAIAAAGDGGDAMVVLITDGGANIARDGSAGRDHAMRDALDSARCLRAGAIPTLVIDCGVRESQGARAVASATGGRYAWLPRANARAVRDVVSAVRRDSADISGAVAP
jgi:magnesium chelatase subunit D